MHSLNPLDELGYHFFKKLTFSEKLTVVTNTIETYRAHEGHKCSKEEDTQHVIVKLCMFVVLSELRPGVELSEISEEIDQEMEDLLATATANVNSVKDLINPKEDTKE